MARGSQAKEEITKKLLETFEGSFLYNGGKEIRIPMMEDGSLLQIKVALTCAKENVESGADVAIPTAAIKKGPAPFEPMTDAEKDEVRNKIAELGL
jgi:hypothetical protein